MGFTTLLKEHLSVPRYQDIDTIQIKNGQQPRIGAGLRQAIAYRLAMTNRMIIASMTTPITIAHPCQVWGIDAIPRELRRNHAFLGSGWGGIG